MTLRILLLIGCLSIVLPLRTSFAAEANVGEALDSVDWNGPGVLLADLEGKTVVVLTYVTWCPKCNAWAPELFAQLKDAAADQPVVIIPVCTDAPQVPGPRYLTEYGLVGRNVVPANDKQMDVKLGLGETALFTATVVGPTGDVVWQGSAGSRYTLDDGSKDYVVARKLRETAGEGTFTLISADMSSEVQNLLWPMEMGHNLSDRDLKRAKRALSAEDRSLLKEAINTYVAKQWQVIDELSAGEIPDQITAYAKAEEFSKTFGSTEEGQQARELVSRLTRESQIKREIVARKAYERLLSLSANQPPAKQKSLRRAFLKRFKGTYFAEKVLATAED